MEAIAANSASMTNPTESSTAARRRRWPKYLAIAAAVLAVGLLISHWMWVASGSNQWELAKDRDGIKVWTLKAPGTGLVKVKATTRLQSKLAGMVKLLEDLDSCSDASCYDGRVIEPLESAPGRYAAYVTFKFNMPGLKPRQYVLLQRHQQDANTKELSVQLDAAPDKIAPDECCVRVSHLRNQWHIVPRDGNQLDVELIQDTDIGGLPYFVANVGLIEGTFAIFHGMQDLMNQEKYRNARVDSVQEWSEPVAQVTRN